MSKKTFVIVSDRPWNRQMAQHRSQKTGDTFHLIDNKDELTTNKLAAIQPSAIFFPHWSHKIPAEIYQNYEAIIFHMTDVPFGRGGSPLQNLIVRQVRETKVTALQCVEELDAGAVYLKVPFTLEGSAQEIFERLSVVIEQMIVRIVQERPQPVPQIGEVTTFKRRRPEQSDLAECHTITELYDHIRMLDAEGYPHAFLKTPLFTIEFTRAVLQDGTVTAQAVFKPTGEV